MSNENKPVHRIRLSTISASIFKNTSSDGNSFFNAQFDRSYKSGEEWKHTKSFGRDDLLNLAKVSDLVHSWIHEQQQNENSAAKPENPAPQ